MTKEELFKKYNIDETHAKWDTRIDNWMSVELFRIMHDGNLPENGDMSILWLIDFKDKFQSDSKFMAEMFSRKDWGSLYLTSKRMIYSMADIILKEINT